ncbi:MAG TPA: ParB/RepB/Spo0J family partition protein [Flavilitoribacter sp.]|nr:ParB/RepB/Spo0J family partition protein [Flavilitoribacter sp.]HMQ88284.1 ParB/RepB/Spo0J family partition protein [Flavilitoribacter sp.]
MAKRIASKTGAKEALGSGIDVLFTKKLDQAIAENPEKVVKDLSSHFALVPIDQIESNPDQPRKDFDPEALQELADSIKVHGIIQPLTVRRLNAKQYQIISGERRWRASKLAGIKEAPAYIRIANDQTLLEMALIENIQREDLNALEIAVSYYRLKEECALTDDQLAERVGKQRSTISNYIRLLDLHVEVQKAIKEGKISMGHARAIAGIKDKLLHKEVLSKILAKELSVRQTEDLTSGYSGNAKKKTPAQPAARSLSSEHEDILQDFREFFGSKKIKMVLEDKEGGKGHILIPFETKDQLHHFFKCVEMP